MHTTTTGEARNILESLHNPPKMKTKDFTPQEREAFDRVRRRITPVKILHLLGIKKKNVKTYVFESCSLVIAHKHSWKITEICWYPRSIEIRKDRRNPLHRSGKIGY